MAIANDRREHDQQKDGQRDCEDVVSRLGSLKEQSISNGNDSNTVFYLYSEGGNQSRAWSTSGGQKTVGGIQRRLKELHAACLNLIDSHQKQLQSSLQASKDLREEIHDLEALLSEVLSDKSEQE